MSAVCAVCGCVPAAAAPAGPCGHVDCGACVAATVPVCPVPGCDVRLPLHTLLACLPAPAYNAYADKVLERTLTVTPRSKRTARRLASLQALHTAWVALLDTVQPVPRPKKRSASRHGLRAKPRPKQLEQQQPPAGPSWAPTTLASFATQRQRDVRLTTALEQVGQALHAACALCPPAPAAAASIAAGPREQPTADADVYADLAVALQRLLATAGRQAHERVLLPLLRHSFHALAEHAEATNALLRIVDLWASEPFLLHGVAGSAPPLPPTPLATRATAAHAAGTTMDADGDADGGYDDQDDQNEHDEEGHDTATDDAGASAATGADAMVATEAMPTTPGADGLAQLQAALAELSAQSETYLALSQRQQPLQEEDIGGAAADDPAMAEVLLALRLQVVAAEMQAAATSFRATFVFVQPFVAARPAVQLSLLATVPPPPTVTETDEDAYVRALAPLRLQVVPLHYASHAYHKDISGVSDKPDPPTPSDADDTMPSDVTAGSAPAPAPVPMPVSVPAAAPATAPAQVPVSLPAPVSAPAAAMSNPGRLRRIHRELTGLGANLPVGWGASIFVCADEARPDVLRALIIGPADTPYQDGCFLFDLTS
jgi:hypothetical protein